LDKKYKKQLNSELKDELHAVVKKIQALLDENGKGIISQE
jgi:hypothetical protein